MKKAIFLFSFLVLGITFFSKASLAQAAGRLYLDPATDSVQVGDTFDVYVWVDPGGAEIGAIDAIINFDPVRLEVVSADEEVYFSNDTLGDFNSFIPKIDNESGKLSLYSYANRQNAYVSVAGKIAKIQFKAKEEGTASVTFVCQPDGSGDSNIWDKEPQDIIDCNTVGSGSYVIAAAAGGGEATTSEEDTTTTTTTTTTSTTEATPTTSTTSAELPQAGIPAPIFLIAAFGLIMTMVGLLVAVI